MFILAFWPQGSQRNSEERCVRPGADPGQKPARIPDQELCERTSVLLISLEVSIDTTYSVNGTKWSLTVFLEEPAVCFRVIICPFNCMLEQHSLS